MTSLKPRILVVDDEAQIHRFLAPALEAAGYAPERADTAVAGLALLARRAPDALILDLGLPDMDGLEVLAKARAFYAGPIVILSARYAHSDKIEALDLGADDYVEKPFVIGELLARLRVATRHRLAEIGMPAVVRTGELKIDFVRRLVTRLGRPVRLSSREYELLAKMVEGGGRALTHKQLLSAVWGPDHIEDVQYLRVFVGHLRRKLEPDPTNPRHIITESGIGYRFVGED